MDLLKTIAFPQPTEHYHLLLLILAFAYVVSVPYLGLVLGSSVLSLRLRRRWQGSSDERLLRFSADLMDVALNDRKLPLFLGSSLRLRLSSSTLSSSSGRTRSS